MGSNSSALGRHVAWGSLTGLISTVGTLYPAARLAGIGHLSVGSLCIVSLAMMGVTVFVTLLRVGFGNAVLGHALGIVSLVANFLILRALLGIPAAKAVVLWLVWLGLSLSVLGVLALVAGMVVASCSKNERAVPNRGWPQHVSEWGQRWN